MRKNVPGKQSKIVAKTDGRKQETGPKIEKNQTVPRSRSRHMGANIAEIQQGLIGQRTANVNQRIVLRQRRERKNGAPK
ncbi:MAG: hypothetical protein J0I23_28815 [Rhizobiales bacterium]|nr:hypothetical protein [Hyphomicrobiales bacterium]